MEHRAVVDEYVIYYQMEWEDSKQWNGQFIYLLSTGGGSLWRHVDFLIPTKEGPNALKALDVLESYAELVIERADRLGAQLGRGLGEDDHSGSECRLVDRKSVRR